jgi:thiosulfate dehydrogenase
LLFQNPNPSQARSLSNCYSINPLFRKGTSLKSFLVGLIIGLIAVPLLVFAYFVTGKAPVATSAPPIPFEKMLAHRALDAHIEKEMPHNAPIPADEPNFLAGAQVYRDHCEVCHATSQGQQTAIAQGMFPKPPKLLVGKGVTDDEAGETYWKVANGIRLTGMPSFGKALSDTQMWQVSLLLANADKLPDSVKQALNPAQASNPQPSLPAPAHTH